VRIQSWQVSFLIRYVSSIGMSGGWVARPDHADHSPASMVSHNPHLRKTVVFGKTEITN